jgi:ABC-type amino acid transport substrate-binding protein
MKNSPRPARAAFLLPLFLLLLAACQAPRDAGPAAGADTSASAGGTLERIRRSGKMRVGYLIAEPMMLHGKDGGEVQGIFADMVRQIAKSLNVEVEWVETNLTNFAAGLQSDLYDFCVGPSFVTIPRAAAVSFTEPIAYVGNSAVLRADSRLAANSLQDFNKKGLRVAVLQGQALEEYSRKNLPEAELIVVTGGDLTAPLVAVSAGRADVGLMNSLTITLYSREHPEVKAVLMGEESVEILPLAWSTRQGDVALRDFLNASISYLGTTGRIYEYQQKQQLQLLYGFPRLAPAPVPGALAAAEAGTR